MASPAPTAWDQTKKHSGSAYAKAIKPGLDKVSLAVSNPVNRLSNKVGGEAFWPTSLAKECDKAARIIRSFCKDGFYAELDRRQSQTSVGPDGDGKQEKGSSPQPQGKQRVLKKIPESVVREAKGLAIFTTARAGFWVSGAGGSGVLVGRDQETGEWSSPSGILVHTVGLGFLVGVDIYDCVVVINTYSALEAFTKTRATLGGEISAVAGPIGIGGVVDSEVHKRQAPVWTYLKSRGFYAGVQVDGTIVSERSDENEAFYGERITAAEILAGKAKNAPKAQYAMLIATIKAAQGDRVDDNYLPSPGQNPGDLEIDTDHPFGIPDIEDPDPYGVKALEAEGLEIREAGTHSKPTSATFEFKPAFTSPVFSDFRKSADYREWANGWRGSMSSVRGVDRGTQTEEDFSNIPYIPAKRASLPESPLKKETEHVDESSDEDREQRNEIEPPESPEILEANLHEEPAQIETAIPVVARARVVNVAKRVPPSLPPRNPNRSSTSKKDDDETGENGMDTISLNDSEYSEHDALEHRKSNVEQVINENDTKDELRVSIDEKGQSQKQAVASVADDEFHSVPPSPIKESQKAIPGAF